MTEKVTYLVIVLLIVVAIIIGMIGYALGKNERGTTPSKEKTTQANSSNTFFDNEQASVNGKITNFDKAKNIITVQNSKNASQDFTLSDKVFISSAPADKTTPATPSSDLNKIELGKNAYINLIMSGGSYKVVTIGYMSDTNIPSSPNTNLPNSKPAAPASTPLPKSSAPTKP